MSEKIITDYDPTRPSAFVWQAVTDNYDGADIDENTASRCPIGYGRTEQEAIADLREQME